VERRIRMAKFAHTKSFDTFDFAAQPSLNKALVLELTSGALVLNFQQGDPSW
jgi:DNA replication protein DnaC